MTLRPAQIPSTRHLHDLRTIGALSLREMASSHGRSALGYLWEVVEPVASILILQAVFTLFMRAPPLGSNFSLFYSSGVLPFLMFTSVAGQTASSLRLARPLLAYPGVTFLHALLARFLLASLNKLVVFALVVSGIMVWFDLRVPVDHAALLLGLGMVLALALAVGTANCLLGAFFPTWDILWGIVTRPLMLLSAVIYTFDSVPLPWRDWLWWNPVVHLVGLVRHALYPTYAADYVSVLWLAGIVAVLLPVSLFFLNRYWREAVERM